ncbi:hypothetical protein BC828DRAFT_408862 [Blastocladiella britannica]|nr:hypothetical protein BC828DRAFT_408862 [Blastocladiella britannica]
MSLPQHTLRVRALYRRSLRTVFDWAKSRDSYRQTAIHVRYMFDDNKAITNPKLLAELMANADAHLDSVSHPEPYSYPTSPNGSKFERNVPVPLHIVEKGLGDYVDPAKEFGKFTRNFVNV